MFKLSEEGKKAMLQELKSRGESHIMLAIDDVHAFAKLYAEQSGNKFLMMGVNFLANLKDDLKELVDQLDGEDDHQA